MEETSCVCCPHLAIVDCGDTDEHKHPMCLRLSEAITNYRVTVFCVSDSKWEECIVLTSPIAT